MPSYKPPSDYAQQLADALASISPQTFGKLYAHVRHNLYYVLLYVPELEPHDLISEAILRTADGRRTWNIDKYPSFAAYLKASADSIAWEYYSEYSKRPDWSEDWNAHQYFLEDMDAEMYAQYLEARLCQRLAGDVVALDVLKSRLEGFHPAETCKKLGINDHIYQAARKRIIRAWEILRRDE